MRIAPALKPSPSERSVSLLGATGSIGSTTLALIRAWPERYPVVALTAQSNIEKLATLAREFRPRFVALGDPSGHAALKEALAGTGIACGSGPQALEDAAAYDADWTMAAIIGIAGLRPTLQAIRRGGLIALANKECLVAAGALVMCEAARCGATLLPVDSEHNAVFQIVARDSAAPVKVTLTASGGPFREFFHAQLVKVTPEQAVRHPNWTMGAKISVDSATLMNKGLELIEAQHLFGLSPEQLDVLVHPQSVVHCLVHYSDGAVLSQMNAPDMSVPIAHTLGWPDRLTTTIAPLDLATYGSLTFERPDESRFPCLALARQAMQEGGSAPLVLNAANEMAVARFLEGSLDFMEIPALIARALTAPSAKMPETLEEIIELDHITRDYLTRGNVGVA